MLSAFEFSCALSPASLKLGLTALLQQQCNTLRWTSFAYSLPATPAKTSVPRLPRQLIEITVCDGSSLASLWNLALWGV